VTLLGRLDNDHVSRFCSALLAPIATGQKLTATRVAFPNTFISSRAAPPQAYCRKVAAHCRSNQKMATQDVVQQDALLLLRQSIASDSPPIPTTGEDESSTASTDLSLAIATHLRFSSPIKVSIPLSMPTRFISSDQPVDLRSIYFAWLKREVAIPEYNASALALNAELAVEGSLGGRVQNLAFVERLDLITWLEGASEESEYIKPLASDTVAAITSAQVAPGVAGGIATVTSGAIGRQNKTIDPRLAEIYAGERRMGDRNSILRGIKPTVQDPSSLL
jgi:parafibromin